MAERRMMSKKIVDSDAFMDMALSTQALYFHLLARADDDGFVGNPKKIMRMIGASEDEYKFLVGKRFVIVFPSGVCVIKHWLIHNLIRSDRYHETQYTEEKKMLAVKENSAYTEMATPGIPNGNQMEPEYRLGKVSIGKDRLGYSLEFEDFWNIYPVKKAKSKAHESWCKLSDVEREKCTPAITKQIETKHFANNKGEDFIPHPTTWLNQKRWEDEVKEIKKLDIIKFDKYGNLIK